LEVGVELTARFQPCGTADALEVRVKPKELGTRITTFPQPIGIAQLILSIIRPGEESPEKYALNLHHVLQFLKRRFSELRRCCNGILLSGINRNARAIVWRIHWANSGQLALRLGLLGRKYGVLPVYFARLGVILF
jgi:hypothetical protein